MRGNNWKRVLWREWRHTPDQTLANALFELTADLPLGIVASLAFTALGAAVGREFGFMSGLAVLNWRRGSLDVPLTAAIPWVEQAPGMREWLIWGAGLGALAAVTVRIVTELPWRALFTRLQNGGRWLPGPAPQPSAWPCFASSSSILNGLRWFSCGLRLSPFGRYFSKTDAAAFCWECSLQCCSPG